MKWLKSLLRKVSSFPIVTYNREEFLRIHEGDDDGSFLEGLDNSYAIASTKNIIWLSHPSKKWLLHELLHIIGWKLEMPAMWHKIIHRFL